MVTINLWDSTISEHYRYVNTIDEVLELIDNGMIKTDVQITNSYTPGQQTNSRLDEIADEQGVELIYTDDKHIAAYSNKMFFDAYIDPSFFEKYKEQLIQMFQKQILESKYSAWIPKLFFNDELFEKLLTRDDLILNFIDINLSEEQKEILRSNYIKAYIHHNDKEEQISDNCVIGSYKKTDLKTTKRISINGDLSDEEIKNFSYLKEGSTLSFNSLFDNLDTDSYRKAKSIIEKADALDKNITFIFNVDRRSKLEESGLLELQPYNVGIVFSNDGHDYSMEEYKEEEAKLNALVADIKKSNMSPFERYIAVYNIVKNYKPYKESDNREESRYLRYILNNEYMVCVGFSTLFIELLDKVGILAKEYGTDVDISYKDGFTQEEKITELAGHRRVVVNLDDDKYDIHGLYLSDPTWDNDSKEDYYNHLIMTFDSMQESNLMFILKDEDLIFDVQNFSDFVEKTNILIKKRIKQSYEEKPINKILDAYNSVYNEIVTTFKSIDSNGEKLISKYIEVPQYERNEDFFTHFFTDAGHYIVERTNNRISRETLIEAISQVKTKSDKQELEEYKKTLEEQYSKRNEKYFPYVEDSTTSLKK